MSQVHGIDVLEEAAQARPKCPQIFANLPPCLIGMEACGSAHHWARKLQTFGHTVKLMAPQFVKPLVTTNKKRWTQNFRARGAPM